MGGRSKIRVCVTTLLFVSDRDCSGLRMIATDGENTADCTSPNPQLAVFIKFASPKHYYSDMELACTATRFVAETQTSDDHMQSTTAVACKAAVRSRWLEKTCASRCLAASSMESNDQERELERAAKALAFLSIASARDQRWGPTLREDTPNLRV